MCRISNKFWKVGLGWKDCVKRSVVTLEEEWKLSMTWEDGDTTDIRHKTSNVGRKKASSNWSCIDISLR